MTTRRNFIQKAAIASAAVTLGPAVFAQKRMGGVFGANERLNVAVIGVHNRAKAQIKGIHLYKDAKILISCDVDNRILKDHSTWCQETIGYKPKEETDFRNVLDNKEIDAVFIATPDHWHTPLAIMALKAGKHVYVEKPCSHNCYEAELLVAAQKKYNKVVQMGNQTRSSVRHQEAIRKIDNGIIGEVFKGEAYYSNNRPSIGKGNLKKVPAGFDWDLWQGPAPREAYKDNIHPYNWHWFRKWGTGEVANNGLHEIDVLRWVMGLKLPKSVTSFGGLHTYDDDWEYTDNQEVTYEFPENKMIRWTGHSRGELTTDMPNAVVYGDKGAIEFSKDDFRIFDLEGNQIGEERQIEEMNSRDTLGADERTAAHVANFFNAIRKGEPLHSPIEEGAISTMLCHYGNIAQNVGRTIYIDPATARIKNDKEAMSYWRREYAEGFELKI